jgi:cyclopropane fatty-acyl-phospholipid synthase-like methyltransferase
MRLAELRSWLGHARRRAEADGEAPALALPLPAAETARAPPPARAPGPPPAWSQQRLRAVETLWGEGFLLPGAAKEVLRLALPLGLSAASSLLLLGAGSGGPAVRLASDFGVWVHACEADPWLLRVAIRRVQRAGAVLAKRATIQGWDPAAPDFSRRIFHHALAIEALAVARPEDTLAAMALAVRPGGQIALLQTVAPAPLEPREPSVAAWLRLDPQACPPPSPAVVGRTLARLGFEVRVAEDLSARHVHLAIGGWREALRAFDRERPDPPQAAALVAEAERWLRRIQLLREGRLKLMRWFAMDRRDPAAAGGAQATEA